MDLAVTHSLPAVSPSNVNAEKDEVGTLLVFESQVDECCSARPPRALTPVHQTHSHTARPYMYTPQEAFAAATAGDEFDAVKAKVMGLLGGPPEVHTFQVHTVFDGKASS